MRIEKKLQLSASHKKHKSEKTPLPKSSHTSMHPVVSSIPSVKGFFVRSTYRTLYTALGRPISTREGQMRGGTLPHSEAMPPQMPDYGRLRSGGALEKTLEEQSSRKTLGILDGIIKGFANNDSVATDSRV